MADDLAARRARRRHEIDGIPCPDECGRLTTDADGGPCDDCADARHLEARADAELRRRP